ncbi:antiviral reverse transcriptase Drt4 [Serratia marcescens]|uniref:antiviral reverse transcriptase Drt4 n=1 Tax=Serratia marcescens TaxID=615 RepID=UPI003AFA7488
MAIFDEKRHLYEALLRYNYFPNQKDSTSEIPPCFSSRTLTPEIAELISADTSKRKGLPGYDCVEYYATRYNNFPRTLSIIHPKAYSNLAKHIHDNWEDIRFIKENESSMVKPDMHVDGRVIIMNYEDAETKTIRELNDGFGRRFKVNTDISGCFTNIYSHSIPWAVRGVNNAKKELNIKVKDKNKHWSDKLDYFQRQAKRNETHGVPIGPATSSIVCEIILSAVDKRLKDDGFSFIRYIDDYTCYCKTHDEAKRFLHSLGMELSKYKLSLNLHKTKITNLPATLNDNWVSLLNVNSPTKKRFADQDLNKLSSSEVINFLDYAVQLNTQVGGGSILKYAISLVINNLDVHTITQVFDYLLNLSWHYPMLIPYLGNLIEHVDLDDDEKYKNKFNEILIMCAENKHSDGMAWTIYFCLNNKIHIEHDVIKEIICFGDCLSLCLLDSTGLYEKEISNFVNDIIKLDYEYDIDRYWLLFYQRFFKGKTKNPYSDKCFDIMKKHGVDFMPDKSYKTKAESYCHIINNPFLEDQDEIIRFNDYIA